MSASIYIYSIYFNNFDVTRFCKPSVYITMFIDIRDVILYCVGENSSYVNTVT